MRKLDTAAVWRTTFPSSAKADLFPDWRDTGLFTRLRFAIEYETAESDKELFEEHVGHLVPATMLDFLELRYPFCHGEAHELGAALARTQDLATALDSCGSRCTNGCMHGVISQAFDAAQSPEALCAQEVMAKRYRPGNCAHAVGHALMRHGSENLDLSLAGCSRFTDLRMEYYCATGVFMSHEEHWKDQYEDGTLVSEEARAFPCHAGSKFPAACYRYFLPLFGELSSLSNAQLLSYCEAPSDRARWGCFHGYGAHFFDAIADNPRSLQLACNQGTEADRAMCIEGVIEKLADHDSAIANQACESLTGKDREFCHAAAKEGMYRLDKPMMKHYIGR